MERSSLDMLPEGATGRVLGLHLTGVIRSRLQDIGLIPGTAVTCIQKGTDLAAYRIRGAVVALRNADARGIVFQAERR